MRLTSGSNAQVYPHLTLMLWSNTKVGKRVSSSGPARRNKHLAFSFDQSALGLRLQKHYPVHSV